MKSPVVLVVVALICLSFVASAQNVTVQVGARPVGTRSALNLESGNEILQTCRDEGEANNRITCVPPYNSALISNGYILPRG